MKERFYSLGRQTLVYGISAAALQFVGLFTLPVFARVFTPAQYGVLEVATAGLAALMVVADLGMASASQRSYFDYSGEQTAERRAVLATALLVTLASASVLAALLAALSGPIAEWLLHSSTYSDLVALVALAVPLSVLGNFLREVLRLQFKAWWYTCSAVAGALIGGAAGVWLVVVADTGVEGVVVGLLVGNAVAIVIAACGALSAIGLRLSSREVRIMLAYGLPLIPAAAAMWGLVFLDRVMLSRLADLDAVGQYAVGARFASVVMLAVTAFGLAYTPFLLSMFSEDREAEKRLRGRTLTYAAIVLCGLSLVLALFAREAVTIIAPDFTEAYQVVGVLCLGVAVYGMSSITMAGISLARRTSYFAYYTLVAVAVNVALNFALIPPLGGPGAALATASAYAALTLLYYRKSQTLYRTPYEPRKVLTVLLLAAILVPLGLLPLGPGFFALKLAGVVAFAVGLLATGVIGQPEIEELKGLPARLTGRSRAATGTGNA